MEEELEERKNVKKHKGLKRPLIAIALAALIAVCGSFVKTSPHNIKGNLTDFVNENAEDTLFDDILDLDETIGIKNIETGEIEQIQVEDAIKVLEERSSIDEKIKALNIKNNNLNELTEETKKKTMEFYNENGIDAIIDLYKDKDNNKIEKARIAQQLLFIKVENEIWLQENGIPVSKSILKRIISAGAIKSYGTFSPKEYEVVELPEEKTGLFKEVFINDPVSGERDKIILSPIITEEYYKAYDEYQDISSKNNYTEEQIIKIVKDTLNYSKRCINKELDLDGILPTTQKIKKLEKKNEE